MSSGTKATLECEVCGGGWEEEGEVHKLTFRGGAARVSVWRADTAPECPECGEEWMWDIAKTEGVE